MREPLDCGQHSTFANIVARASAALAAGLTVAIVCGCASYSTHHTARSTPKNTVAGALATGVLWTLDRNVFDDIVLPLDWMKIVPTVVELQVREGLTDRIDVGMKAYVTGLMFDLNWTILQIGNFAMSVNPAVCGFACYFPGEENDLTGGKSALASGAFWTTVLFDVVQNRFVTVTVAPRAAVAFTGSSERGSDGTESRGDGMRC